MSIETQLRSALRDEASTAASPETDPYARVSAAVGRNRRRRRAVGIAALAAVSAIAIGLPTVASRLGNDVLPASQRQLPEASDKAWNSVTTWPLRGVLRADSGLVDAVQDKFNGRAVFVEDVDTKRVAFIVRGDQLIIATGPRGAAGEALVQRTQMQAPNIRQDSLLSMGAGRSLVILTTPDRTSAEVSGTPDIALDGTVTRSWRRFPMVGGIGRTALSPLTRLRLDGFTGPVQYPLTEEAARTTLNPCEDGCTGPQATTESRTTADIARTLGLDPTQISTTTLFNGEVPPEATTSAPTASGPGAPSLVVMHSRLPGGQILRTAALRSADEARSINLGGPIDARQAGAVPLVISATGDLGSAPTSVRVFVASGTGLRAVSDGTKSAVIPITGNFATFTLPITQRDFWASYRLEVLDRGNSLGTFAVTFPMTDAFEVDS